MSSSPSPAKNSRVALGRLHPMEEKKQECEKLIKSYGEGRIVEGFCPPIWDEIMCWDETKAGKLVLQRCPRYIDVFSPHKYASKECMANGSWYKKPGLNPTWTNFSQCMEENVEDYIQPYIPTLKKLADTGYSVSLISLLMAFTILISIKKLRCPRNVLHMHLFASFIMRAFMTLLKNSLFPAGLLYNADLNIEEDQGTWWCRMIFSLWNYFIMANYSWILMEGLYLHNLIFQALFTDSSSIFLYVVLGWGLPILFVVSWTLCRSFLENEFCWTTHDYQIIYLLIKGPIAASIVVNFILFIRIIIVLLEKLQSSISEEPKTYRRWAKSTLVLIPLFGVHYMVLFGLQYSTNPVVEIVWLFCDQFFSCFNGFCVALLYCFLNGDVRNELSKIWNTFSFRELLEKWHLYGPDSVFSSSRYFGDRYRRPRESCHSNSCTVDTIVLSCNRDKKRQAPTTTTVSTQGICTTGGKIQDLNDMKNGLKGKTDTSEVRNGVSLFGKDRRWSASDCNFEKNAVELKRMTTSNNNIVQV